MIMKEWAKSVNHFILRRDNQLGLVGWLWDWSCCGEPWALLFLIETADLKWLNDFLNRTLTFSCFGSKERHRFDIGRRVENTELQFFLWLVQSEENTWMWEELFGICIRVLTAVWGACLFFEGAKREREDNRASIASAQFRCLMQQTNPLTFHRGQRQLRLILTGERAF